MGEISAANIARAEELLPKLPRPIVEYKRPFIAAANSYADECRPLVSQALQDKDDRIAELERHIETLRARIVSSEQRLCEVDP